MGVSSCVQKHGMASPPPSNTIQIVFPFLTFRSRLLGGGGGGRKKVFFPFSFSPYLSPSAKLAATSSHPFHHTSFPPPRGGGGVQRRRSLHCCPCPYHQPPSERRPTCEGIDMHRPLLEIIKKSCQIGCQCAKGVSMPKIMLDTVLAQRA